MWMIENISFFFCFAPGLFPCPSMVALHIYIFVRNADVEPFAYIAFYSRSQDMNLN